MINQFILFVCFFCACFALGAEKKINSTSAGIDFVLIPEGSFNRDRGAGKRSGHRLENQDSDKKIVMISQFMMAASEISWKQWRNIMGQKGADRVFQRIYGRALSDDDLNFPVSGVTYFEIVRFCELLTKRLIADDEFVGKASLPTEAQWEYVAKCGKSVVAEENVRKKNDPVLNVRKCMSGNPNQFGIYDILGNVSEFNRDIFVESLPGGKDPKITSVEDISSLRFVVRGGSFLKDRSCANSAYRVSVFPDYHSVDTGFRVVWEKK